MGELDGRVALITGAARGMGRSHAVRLARAGADIIALDICRQIDEVPPNLATEEDLAETVRLVEQHGRRAVPAIADVRDRGGLRDAVDAAVARFGRLDIVVPNAGTFVIHLEQPTSDAGRHEVWQTTLDINLTGVWNTIEVAVPHVLAGGRGGSVVLISSMVTYQIVPNDDIGFTAYAVSKWGVLGLTKMLAGDLAKHGIRVNAVHPGGVDTPLIQSEAVTSYWNQHQELADYTSKAFRPITANDVSEAVLYLASDASTAVTGISIPIDDGAMVRWD